MICFFAKCPAHLRPWIRLEQLNIFVVNKVFASNFIQVPVYNKLRYHHIESMNNSGYTMGKIMRTSFKLISFVLCQAFLLTAAHSQPPENMPPFHPHRVLVKFKTEAPAYLQIATDLATAGRKASYVPRAKAPENALTRFCATHRITALRALAPGVMSSPEGIERLFVAEIEPGASVEQVVPVLAASAAVEYAEPDFTGYGAGAPVASGPVHLAMVPNDPGFSNQWGFLNTGQFFGGANGTPGADINITPAWDITTGDPNMIIAILDTGVPTGASEFAGRLMQGHDYANNDNDPSDDYGHGCNVASIIAATGNNGQVIAGVNWQSRILPMKILNSNNLGYYSWWAAALVAASDSGAKVINMSVGGSSASRTLQDAVDYAAEHGAFITVAMMNTNNDVTYYPAAYPNVFAIGATNNRDQRAVPFCSGGGSCYGEHIDFVAPGDWIIGLKNTNPTQTSYWCGTSQATPMVAGVISLLLAVKPDLTFSEVYNLLKAGAHDQIGPPAEDTPGWDKYFGWGRIDAYATLTALTTDVRTAQPLPQGFALAQNYPNPFNPSTTIRYRLAQRSRVVLEILNVQGQRVVLLAKGEQPPGEHSVQWLPQVASGIYFYRLQVQQTGRNAGIFSETRKMIFMQ